MTEPQDTLPENAKNGERTSLPDNFLREIMEDLGEGESARIREKILALPLEDQAELFIRLAPGERKSLLEALGERFDKDVLPYLPQEILDDVIRWIGAGETAAALREFESDDALHVIERLPETEQQQILDTLRDESVREEIEAGLSYPESSAGRLMRRQFLTVPEFWSVGDTIDFLRSGRELPDDFYVIFVVDPRFHPIGEVRLSKLMQHRRETKISEIMNGSLRVIDPLTDQEEVAHLFRKYGLVEAPVNDGKGRLIGSITVDDVVDVMQEELEEDFLRAGGIANADLNASLAATVRLRFPWLFINLLTAVAASIIIDIYSEAISQLVILAVLMPIVASMGGNAGIQASTVTVRAIALRRLRPGGAFSMIRRELILGFVNGIGIALVTAAGIYLIYHDARVAGIFAIAVTVTMMLAGLSGAALPLMLRRLGADPAVSSGIFLTTVTDIVGFLSFLGLAAWMVS